MSANIVTRTHLNALVTAMLEFHSHGNSRRAMVPALHDRDAFAEERKLAAHIGAALLSENIAGVRECYRGSRGDVVAEVMRGCDGEASDPFVFTAVSWPVMSPREIPSADLIARAMVVLDGYEYHACDSPTWSTSIAKRECDSLRAGLCAALWKATRHDRMWCRVERDAFTGEGLTVPYSV